MTSAERGDDKESNGIDIPQMLAGEDMVVLESLLFISEIQMEGEQKRLIIRIPTDVGEAQVPAEQILEEMMKKCDTLSDSGLLRLYKTLLTQLPRAVPVFCSEQIARLNARIFALLYMRKAEQDGLRVLRSEYRVFHDDLGRVMEEMFGAADDKKGPVQ